MLCGDAASLSVYHSGGHKHSVGAATHAADEQFGMRVCVCVCVCTAIMGWRADALDGVPPHLGGCCAGADDISAGLLYNMLPYSFKNRNYFCI